MSLANDEDLLVLLLEDGLLAAGVLAGEEGVEVGGVILRDDLGDVLHVVDEELVLRDKVALALTSTMEPTPHSGQTQA